MEILGGRGLNNFFIGKIKRIHYIHLHYFIITANFLVFKCLKLQTINFVVAKYHVTSKQRLATPI